MSADLDFWNYQDGFYLDNAAVYRDACCDQRYVEGLEVLPTEAILAEIRAAFEDWATDDPLTYEQKGTSGSFMITTTPQTVRFDCYSMEQADMKRFPAILSKFGCPLYDPQLDVRFDKIRAYLIDEAAGYEDQIRQAFSRLLPRMELIVQATDWDSYAQMAKPVGHMIYDAGIHRAKTLTKASSFLRCGSIWSDRQCQCKTAQLTDPDAARKLLADILQRSLKRAVDDIMSQTYLL